MITVLVLPQNNLTWKLMKGLHCLILNWTFPKFLDFYEKEALVKRKKLTKIISINEKNPENILKLSWKKLKNFKAISEVLDHSKPKIFSVGQPWWPTFFGDLGSSNYFSGATALHLSKCFFNTSSLLQPCKQYWQKYFLSLWLLCCLDTSLLKSVTNT